MNIKSHTINMKRNSSYIARFNVTSVYTVFPNINIETDCDIRFSVSDNSKSESTIVNIDSSTGINCSNYDKTISLIIPDTYVILLTTTRYYYELYMIYNNNKYILTYGSIYMQD